MNAMAKALNGSVVEWYNDTFKTDDIMHDNENKVTFIEVFHRMVNGEDFYHIIDVGDSIVRERIFERLSDILNCDYDDIYYLWLR